MHITISAEATPKQSCLKTHQQLAQTIDHRQHMAQHNSESSWKTFWQARGPEEDVWWWEVCTERWWGKAARATQLYNKTRT